MFESILSRRRNANFGIVPDLHKPRGCHIILAFKIKSVFGVAMKTCPACRTQYSDDTLQFCLQDGTPLVGGPSGETPTVVLGETETVVTSGRGSAPTAWPQSQVTHVATGVLEPKRPNTAIAVVATICGMLVLFGIIGAAVWIFLLDPGRQVAQNSNANVTGGVANNTAPGTKASPATNSASSPVRTVDPPSPPPVDDSQVRSEVSQRLTSWKSRAESLDLNGYMGHYAGTVDYYRKSGASSAFVRADKLRAFSRYSSMRVNLSNMSVSTDPSGQEATVTMDKEWDFQGNGTSSGKVRQLMRLRKINGQWLITAEKDLKVYYTR